MSTSLGKGAAAFAIGAVKASVACYVALCAFLFLFQDAFIFHPGRDDVSGEARFLPGGSAVRMTAPNGDVVIAWWRPPSPGSETILYLHGNGRSLSERLSRLSMIAGSKRGMLAVSWRGFGGSGGSPSGAALEEDAAMALSWLSERVERSSVVVFGESLGTALAVRLAAGGGVRGLVLDSPYDSMADLAGRRFPYVPTGFLLRHSFDAGEVAHLVSAPILVTRCRRDGLTPYESASALLARFRAPVTDLVAEWSCHIPFMGLAMDGRFEEWLASVRRGAFAAR